MSLILCPKCSQRNWSQDYFVCSNCGYEESREWVLLEENKDFSESRNKGDNPALNLSFWMEEQENLTKQMINECLPKGKYNWEVNYPQSLGKNVAGDTEYHENDFQEAELFKKRHREVLIDKGYFRLVDKLITNHKGQQWWTNTAEILYPYRVDFLPSKIRLPKWLLTYEGSYNFNGEGYFPVVPHESAHASPEVKRHPNFKPFAKIYSPGWGHDDIHNNKNREFYDKLTSLGYQEKVKGRFEELRKIQGKDEG